MGTVVDIVSALILELNAEGWSQSFVARRHYRPRYDAAELRTLTVTIVPRRMTIAPDARDHDVREIQIDLAIQQRLSQESNEEIDVLLNLVDEITRHFRLRRLAAMPQALCTKVENDPVYAVEHLDELRCFTSIITLSFRMVG